MDDRQRLNQMRAICAEYRRQVNASVLWPLHEDMDESRKIWASEKLCRLISSLTVCSDVELNALRDILNGKPPKIHARLRVLLSATKSFPDDYVTALMSRDERFTRFRSKEPKRYRVEDLPIHCAYVILKQEESRSYKHNQRKGNWKPLRQDRKATNVQPEQQQLWGR